MQARCIHRSRIQALAASDSMTCKRNEQEREDCRVILQEQQTFISMKCSRSAKCTRRTRRLRESCSYTRRAAQLASPCWSRLSARRACARGKRNGQRVGRMPMNIGVAKGDLEWWQARVVAPVSS